MSLKLTLMSVIVLFTAAPAFSFGTVAGNVTDAYSQPLPGISVQFYKVLNGSTVAKTGTTDSLGNYTVSGLSAGCYKVIFYGRNGASTPLVQKWYKDAGSYTAAATITVTDNATTSDVNAVMGGVAHPRLDMGSITSAAPGTVVMVPVTLTTGGAAISAPGLTVTFDPNKIRSVTSYDPATNAPSLGAVAIAAKKSVLESMPTAGSFTIGFLSSNNTNVIGDGVLVNLFFDVAANATGPITLTSVPSASDPSGMEITITGTSGSISF